MTTAVSDNNFKSEVIDASSKITVIVDFWAPWCGPCVAIGPALEDISSELAGKVKIVKVNVDENVNAATDYMIRSIPCLVAIKDGKEVDRKVGGLPKPALAQWIKSHNN